MSTGLKKESEILEKAAAQLLASALDAGADSAEVCGSFTQRTKVTLEKQDYHLASSDEGYQLGLRVLRGNKQGFASCNVLDSKELREIAVRAVEIAGFSPENPHWTIQGSALVPNDAPQGFWDDRLAGLSLKTQKDWAELLMNEACTDKRFRLNEGSIGISAGLFLILNSLGTHKFDRETVATWGLMGMAVDGSNITSFDYFGEMSREAAGVPERIVTTTRKFSREILENLNQAPAESYRGLVVFSPRAVIDIFASAISYHLNGRNLVEGTSRWKQEDKGRAVLDSRLHFKDMPWLKDRAGASLFDREGTPTRPTTLIDGGKLSSFLLDHYSAHALGTASTGHAVGGPSNVPNVVGPHCLCIGAGTESLQELHSRVSSKQPHYLVVRRYSGSADPVTGDFSGVAKGGEWWVDGKKVRNVKETLIAGNLFDALGKNCFGVSRDTQVIDSAEESPTLVCENISVTA